MVLWQFHVYRIYSRKTDFQEHKLHKILGLSNAPIHIRVCVSVCVCVCVFVFLLVRCNTDSIGKLSNQTKKTRWLELGYKPFCCSHINQFSLFKCNKIHIITVAPTYCLWTYKERRFLSINSDRIKNVFYLFIFLIPGGRLQV